MSHTQTIVTRPPATSDSDQPEEQVWFHFKPDLSGDVLIEVGRYHDGVHVVEEVSVPGKAILEFVGDRMREAAIAALEDADWPEFTGGLTG